MVDTRFRYISKKEEGGRMVVNHWLDQFSWFSEAMRNTKPTRIDETAALKMLNESTGMLPGIIKTFQLNRTKWRL